LLCRYLGLVSEWLFAWAPMPLGDSKYVFTSLQPFYRPFPRSWTGYILNNLQHTVITIFRYTLRLFLFWKVRSQNW
jgi:hypothetical protein